VAKQFNASYATTDYQQALADPQVDAVLLATRHNLHAEMALQALHAGKHVMVEKPLALTEFELSTIENFYARIEYQAMQPILLTGFNRRFSPIMRRIQEIIQHRSNPMIINYRMNAGYIPLDHWVHGSEGGGRNLGEACHIYDLFTYLTNSQVLSVVASTITPKTTYYSAQDNFVATMTFADGSVATLTYTALGAKEYPKEHMEIFVDGKVLAMHDYKTLKITGANIKGIESKTLEKGQMEEMIAFAKAIQQGGDWPIPFWQQVQATKISFLIENALA
jgi:predicted dehydrogenase